MRRWILALWFVFGIAGAVQADYDCGTSTVSPWCTCTSVSYAKNGHTVSFTFGSAPGGGDGTYVCGQYANLDAWVVGEGSPQGVNVTAMSPALTTPAEGFMNGYQVNPITAYETHLDGRPKHNGTTVTNSLPFTYLTGSGAASLMKAKSNASVLPCNTVNGCASPMLEMAAIVTFVPSVPDSNGDGTTADEFRPSHALAATSKPGPFRVDSGFSTRLDRFPAISKTGVAARATINWTLAQVADNRRFPIWWSGQRDIVSIGWGTPRQSLTPVGDCDGPIDYWNCRPQSWGPSELRVLLDDFNKAIPAGSDSRNAIISMVQRGIDIYAMGLTGADFRNPYPNLGQTNGIALFPEGVLAAYLLNNTSMRAYFAGTGGPFPGTRLTNEGPFTETDWAYIGVGGVGFFGMRRDDREQCGFGSKRATNFNFDSFCSLCGEPAVSGDICYGRRWMNAAPYQFSMIALIAKNDSRISQIFNQATALKVITSTHASTPGRGYGTTHTQGLWCGVGQWDNNSGGICDSVVTYKSNFGNAVIAQAVSEGKWPDLDNLDPPLPDDAGTPPQCNDGVDNDGDGKTDYPTDPGCVSILDNDETDPPPPPPPPPVTQCNDGVDNDGDGLIDLADPGCVDANDDSESNLTPGAVLLGEATLSGEAKLGVTDSLVGNDADGDGIIDANDKCLNIFDFWTAFELWNGDRDSDGFGDICDPDFDNNNAVGISDLAILRSCFGVTDFVTRPECSRCDTDSNGAIGVTDLAIFRQYFGKAPGPSCCGTTGGGSSFAPGGGTGTIP